MIIAIMKTLAKVICRIGSLEKNLDPPRISDWVICRIGSLEILCDEVDRFAKVICRIGSLETKTKALINARLSYLPYRQLRKYCL